MVAAQFLVAHFKNVGRLVFPAGAPDATVLKLRVDLGPPVRTQPVRSSCAHNQTHDKRLAALPQFAHGSRRAAIPANGMSGVRMWGLAAWTVSLVKWGIVVASISLGVCVQSVQKVTALMAHRATPHMSVWWICFQWLGMLPHGDARPDRLRRYDGALEREADVSDRAWSLARPHSHLGGAGPDAFESANTPPRAVP
jgi:hypothetical protein